MSDKSVVPATRHNHQHPADCDQACPMWPTTNLTKSEDSAAPLENSRKTGGSAFREPVDSAALPSQQDDDPRSYGHCMKHGEYNGRLLQCPVCEPEIPKVALPSSPACTIFWCAICGDSFEPCKHFIHNHPRADQCSPKCPLFPSSPAPTQSKRFFIDTEFIESGAKQPIELLSVGIVCEDGRELYAVNEEAVLANANAWVRENVIPHLLRYDNLKVGEPRRSRDSIRQYILDFVGDGRPEFWGYYADYDWVVFCQIFGTMMDLPKGWPMYCRDIKQLCADKGDPKLPEQKSAEHNALNDARWNLEAFNFVAESVPSTPSPTRVTDRGWATEISPAFQAQTTSGTAGTATPVETQLAQQLPTNPCSCGKSNNICPIHGLANSGPRIPGAGKDSVLYVSPDFDKPMKLVDDEVATPVETASPFERINVPECSCNSSAILDLGLHHSLCQKRVAIERNCMVTHDYYKAGWNAGRAELESQLTQARTELAATIETSKAQEHQEITRLRYELERETTISKIRLERAQAAELNLGKAQEEIKRLRTRPRPIPSRVPRKGHL